MRPFFVYLLRCADGSYYAGHTDDLERRVAQHGAGEIEGYTSRRRPVELVWSAETSSREEALASELRIKGWSRAKKEALIAGDWARVSELAKASTGSARTEGVGAERGEASPGLSRVLAKGSVRTGRGNVEVHADRRSIPIGRSASTRPEPGVMRHRSVTPASSAHSPTRSG